MPLTCFATNITFQATSSDPGFTTPTPINGFINALKVPYIQGTTTATSTFTGGIQANILNTSSTTASSTFANGINLNNGCFSVSGTCITSGGSGTNFWTNSGATTTLNTGSISASGAFTATSSSAASYFFGQIVNGNPTGTASTTIGGVTYGFNTNGQLIGTLSSGTLIGLTAQNNNASGAAFQAVQGNPAGYGLYAIGGIEYLSGFTGIGTTSPWRTLSVNGSSDLGINALAGSFTGTTTNVSTLAGPLSIGTTANDNELQVTKTVVGGLSYPLKIQNMSVTDTGSVAILFDSDGPAVGRGKGGIAYQSNVGSWGRGSILFLNNNSADSSLPALTDAKMVITNAGNVGVGTSTPFTNFTVVGDMFATGSSTALRFINGGGNPTIAGGTGGGSATPTLTASSDDSGGTINLTTGVTPTASAVAVTLTFKNAKTANCSFSPANSSTALLSGTSMVFITNNGTNFTLTAGTVALTGVTAYSWAYTCHE